MANIRKMGETYHVQYRVNGRQRSKSAGKFKKDAENLKTQIERQLLMGEYLELPKIAFTDFSENWLRDYAKPNVRPATYVSYDLIIRVHLLPVFGKLLLSSISPPDIQGLIAKKIASGLSPKTVGNILVVLKNMLKCAVEWGYLRSDPSTYIKRPKSEDQEMDFLTPDEVKALLPCIRPKFHALFACAIFTGMRRGELLALQWGDIDWGASLIHVRRSIYRGRFQQPKTRYSKRRIVVTPYLRQILWQHHESSPTTESDLIFCHPDGKPLDPDNLVRNEFVPALKRAGLRRIRFHDLRHTFASLLIAQGENIKLVQSQLGHASATTTLNRYAHLMPMPMDEVGRRLDRLVLGIDAGVAEEVTASG